MRAETKKHAEYLSGLLAIILAFVVVTMALVELHLTPFGFWRTGLTLWAALFLLGWGLEKRP